MRHNWIPLLVALGVFAIAEVFVPLHGLTSVLIAVGAGGVLALVAFAVPQMLASRKGGRIDDDIPFFITHFGVLATSNLPRTEVLRILSENKEYKDIAAEMARVLRLTTDWGLGLSDAVRAVAQSTPSKTFAAFLLRLAHALEAGQQMESFLVGEQRVVMAEYRSLYHADLLRVEAWKEIYTNTLMTVGFLAIFASILPLFAGGTTLLFTVSLAGLTILIEVLMGVVLQERLPHDKLSPNRPVRTAFERRLQKALAASIVVAVLLGTAVYFWLGLGPAIIVATVPLVVPGLLAQREEQAIRQREADYPAFIRSLGSAAAARGGSVRGVLGSLQANNLGRLNEPVRDLHRRLMWRVDDGRAWRAFGEETESRLIDSFSTMFVEGIAAGGKPGPISDIISHNMLDLLALRTERRATAGTFRGLLMSLGIGLSLVLFMGSGILASLTTLFSGHSDVLAQQGLFTFVSAEDTKDSQQVLLVLVAAHGIASGLFFQLVQGGRVEGATFHAAINVAVAVTVGLLLLEWMPKLLVFG